MFFFLIIICLLLVWEISFYLTGGGRRAFVHPLQTLFRPSSFVGVLLAVFYPLQCLRTRMCPISFCWLSVIAAE